MSKRGGSHIKTTTTPFPVCNSLIKSNSMKHPVDFPPPQSSEVVLCVIIYSCLHKAGCDICNVVSPGAVVDEIRKRKTSRADLKL